MEIKHYMTMLRKKWWLIALIVSAACIASGVKSFFFTTPIYEANAKLILTPGTSQDQTGEPNVGTLQTNVMLINSYKEVIKSKAIMDEVVERYPELDKSAVEMGGIISVNAANNSQVMNLSYQDPSYEKAVDVVNAVSVVFKEQIPNIMKVDNVTILTEADPDGSYYPINNNIIMNILISFSISLMLAIGLIFLIDYLDETVKTEDEIKEALGIPVLAVVGKITKNDLRKQRNTNITNKKQAGDGQYAALNQ